LATIVIADTPQDAAEFAIQTRTRPTKWKVVRVGADPHLYFPLSTITPEPRSILFYGTYIPLQGIEYIVRSSLLIPREYTITLVGNGQLREETETLIRKLRAPIQLKDQVPESELALLIAKSQVCLGVFGAGAKTQRVIPNKVYQCLAVGRPVITCHSPAIEILGDAVFTVPPGNPEAIATAITTLVEDDDRREAMAIRGHDLFQKKFSEEQLRTDFLDALASLS
jgi:glycosyltransferase involved in cell wall biosynthesis